MDRIAARFNSLAQQKRAALAAYIVAGDPAPQHTPALMHALVRGGADLIELGYPFSDPMAEGPVIQRAHERSLAAGTDLPAALHAVREFRQQDADTPVVLMGYANPVERIGYTRFAANAANAGADALLVVDLPLEEARKRQEEARRAGLELILLIAPTTSQKRLQSILSHAGGFLYYIALRGVTGASAPQPEQIRSHAEDIRNRAELPLCIGFGIKSPQQAATIAEFADGIVVGTALVERIAQMAQQDAPAADIAADLERLAAEFSAALAKGAPKP